MSALTRRRSGNSHHETWRIYLDDVCIGTIGRRAGVPVEVDQWGWSCGFYPGLEPGQHCYGSAETFDLAREAFEDAWRQLQPNLPTRAFDEYRRDRAWRADLEAKRARGEKLWTQEPNSLMRCVCGIVFDSHKPAESYDHRAHIYAAQSKVSVW
jgi:hypothetical protein